MVQGPMLIVIFLIGMAFILLSIIKYKVNPFIALLLASLLIAFMVGIPINEIPGTITEGFGSTLKGIGIMIGLGIVLGELLSEAKATEQIANTLLGKVGAERSPLAINMTGFLVSIPVFFDAAFVILIPLIKQLSKKTKISLITFVTSLSVGLIVTHSVVIPTPGPVTVASNMGVNVGVFIFYSLIVAIPASLVGGYLYGKYLGKKYPYNEKEVEDIVDSNYEQNTSTRPSGSLSITLLLLPIVLILLGTLMVSLLNPDSPLSIFFGFIGDKNIALLIAVIISVFCLRPYFERSLEDIMATAAEQAGMILLITGTGGSLGNVINKSGIGSYIVEVLSGWNVSIIVLAFLLSQILKAAQGSTTVALVTTSSILGPMAYQLGVSPVLVGLAICCGGTGLSLPNDSGFWVVNRFSGFPLKRNIEAWTIGGFIAGFTGFIIVLILSMFANILPGL